MGRSVPAEGFERLQGLVEWDGEMLSSRLRVRVLERVVLGGDVKGV